MGPRETLFAFNQAAMSHDWGAVAKYIQPDYRVREAPSMPYPGDYVGLDGVKRLIATVLETWTDIMEPGGIPPTVLELGEVNGRVAVLMLHTITSRVGENGAPISMPMAELTYFVDGLMAETVPYYWDTAAVQAAWLSAGTDPR